MSPNRIVTLLTPVFAGLAGSLSVWMAENLPGAPAVDEAGLTAIFVAGATSATAAAWKWLQGWQRHEDRAEYERSEREAQERALSDYATPDTELEDSLETVVGGGDVDAILSDPSIARLDPNGPLSQLVEQLRTARAAG